MIKHFTAVLLGASTLVFTAPAMAGSSELAVLDSKPAPVVAPDGQSINELSGLAWDADEKLLYAVSDDGILHHFRLEIADGKIASLEPVLSVPLKAGVTSQVVNAEGLAVTNGDNGKQGDTELLVAFEDGPAIHRFKADGTSLGALQLPKALADASNYSEANSRLEAVAVAGALGVVTAPEEALLGEPGDTHTIHGLDGKRWSLATFQPKRSNLKAIEPMPDGRLLLLERTREQKGGPSSGRLRVFDPKTCGEANACAVENLDPGASQLLNDKFEGLTALGGDLYLLVTDKTKKEGPANFVLVSVKSGV
ncbi:esterase-like activity of phytase family protein [Aminobacter anthyllidis]|uniref:esterase-like activity of phytase family protein n=1 Tax=Aminobacter anthyllidis TaxID=1035067 RepID=UPI002457E4E5|nr:esterase-like activity of phytase family protein [Aminobacter anthyllidis]MDH4984393.1 esterase-like activity of phytase family protein [Aminobacter anthyllidis]